MVFLLTIAKFGFSAQVSLKVVGVGPAPRSSCMFA